MTPTSTTIGPLHLVKNTTVELGRFYADPPLGSAAGFSISGNLDVVVHLDRPNGDKLSITVYLYDFDPVTGATTQIGQQSSGTLQGSHETADITFLPANITGVIKGGTPPDVAYHRHSGEFRHRPQFPF